MNKFTILQGLVAPMDRENVDTDAIIPKQFLKSIRKSGFGPNLFDEWRYTDPGYPGQDPASRKPNPDFVLNQPRYAGASILLARKNFGCGSSREHAPWALEQYGFRALIAPSYADIFFNNSFKNGLLPIQLPEAIVSQLFDEVHAFPGYQLTIDLERQVVVRPQGEEIPFEVQAFRKYCLLNGFDDIGLTLRHKDKIKAFEAERLAQKPWLAHTMVGLEMTRQLDRRQFHVLLASSAVLAATRSHAQSGPWADVETARGQTVYFNAWGGSPRINDYLKWAAGELARSRGVKLEHVKLTDTADVVKRVRSEKAAGKLQGGSVDLVWINGENFLAMKREGLLFGPFADKLPNAGFVDWSSKPTTRIDFSEPVEGMEAPWGMAQLTFYAEGTRLPKPPASVAALLDYARAYPGRISYPRPPDFTGTTFLKQAWLERSATHSAHYKPYSADSFAQATEGLWRYLDELHPYLWRQGKQFPSSAAALRQMMADGELHLGMTFNPNEAANEIAANRMPAGVISYQFESGTIGNTHFLAIPFNANASAGAQVVANFLMSPVAQARKADIKVWGDPTVLAMDKLSAPDRALFTQGLQPGQVTAPKTTLPEPHGSWVDPLEKEWLRRYGR